MMTRRGARLRQSLRAGGVLLVLSMAFGGTVHAQQEARQAIPDTRNPQSSPVQPYQTDGDLQMAETEELMKSNHTIHIPAGQPAQAEEVEPLEDGSGSLAWLAVPLGLVGFGLLAAWLRGGRTAAVNSEPMVGAAVVSPPAKQQKSPKKKSTGKPRAKRKKRY